MWEESWINLMMEMKDMPHYHYKKDGGVKEGTIDDLRNHFAKYIKK